MRLRHRSGRATMFGRGRPLFAASPEQCAAEQRRARLAEEDARAWRRQFVRRWLTTVVWPLIGMVLILLAARTGSPSTGLRLLVLGQVVGYGGFLFTLLYQYVSASERGDW